MTPEPPPRRSPGTPTTSAAPDVMWPLFLDVLRKRGHVTFMLADLADQCGRVYFDHSVVVLDRANDPAAMRSTTAHELQHLDCPDCDEDEIEDRTARLLVPLPAALAAAQIHGGARAVADRLGVDPQLVHARIRSIAADGDAASGVG